MEIDIVDSLTNIRVFKGCLGYSKFVRKISRYQKFSKHENYLNFQLKFLTYTQRFTEIKTFSSVFLASDELPIPHQFVICMKIAKWIERISNNFSRQQRWIEKFMNSWNERGSCESLKIESRSSSSWFIKSCWKYFLLIRKTQI